MKNRKTEENMKLQKTSAMFIIVLTILLIAGSGIQETLDLGKRTSASIISSGIFSPDFSNDARSDLSYLCYMTPIQARVSSRIDLSAKAPALGTSDYFVNRLKIALLPAEELSPSWNLEAKFSYEPIVLAESEPKTQKAFPKDEALEAIYRKFKAEVDRAIETAWESNNQLEDEPLALEKWMTEDNVWALISPPKDEVEELLETMARNEANRIFESLERTRHLNELLTVEKEAPLELEAWICEDITPAPLDKAPGLDPYLAELVRAKNEEILLVLQLQTKCRDLLALDEEPVLCLEDWMTDEACWCPDKEQREKIPPVSYAMKTDN